MNRTPRQFALALTLLLATFAFGGSANASPWMWSFTPYGWLAGAHTQVTVNDREVADSKVTFRDLTIKLNFAAQGHFEGQSGRNGFFVDGTYLNLGSDKKIFGIVNSNNTIKVWSNQELTMIDGVGIYNPSANGQGFSLLYGTRLIYASLSAKLDFSSPVVNDRRYDTTKTLFDGLVGLRYVAPVNDRWLVHFRADVSGGSTKFTWNTMLGFGYSFGEDKRYTALAGYRYMVINFKDAGGQGHVETDTTIQGAIVGLKIGW